MESERLRITLDNPERIYFGGEAIKGEIWMNLNKRTKIRAIKVKITGKGKCKWLEILRKSSNISDSNTRSLFYSGKDVYSRREISVSAFEPNGIELNAGEHTFEFLMPLEVHFPSSFKGSYGSIKYKMLILIQRPWTFDERHTISFTVIKHMPLQLNWQQFAMPLEKQVTKTISLFGTRPITLLAILPFDCVVRGETLRICVTVMNNSTTNVEKLRFTVLQYVTYWSHMPLIAHKIECLAIANKETGAVHKKSERSFAHELLIPETAQPTDKDFSRVITIHYELRVEAVLRGFFKNLVLNLPFTIYSHDAAQGIVRRARSEPPLPPPPPESGDCGASAAVALPAAVPMPAYPALDSSIGSPTHSSQYSECSSINSTASDSSAATLSPAIGVVAFESSYTLGSQSSQCNSPAARASIHSSSVPYMPYSTSPLMVQSYPPPTNLPPYALAESPQYTLMAHAGLTPPPPSDAQINERLSVYSQLPSTSTSFLNRRPQTGVHELPPSYEELFGNATAPPASPK